MKRLAWLVLLGCAVSAGAQEIQLGDAGPVAGKKQYVELEDSAVQVKAGEDEAVELRFRVLPGLHINSAAPKDETLIATRLRLESSAGVRVLATELPKGVPFHLGVGEGGDLDTYRGEFRARVRLKAAKGTGELKGELRYQACDNASCFPPRSLPVDVVVTAR